MRKAAFTILTILTFAAHSPEPASAIDYLLDPLSGGAAPGEVYGVIADDGFQILAETGRSYYCKFTPLFPAAEGDPGLDLASDLVSQHGSYPTINGFEGFVSRTFIPTVGGAARLAVTRTSVGGEQVKVDCKMTTLFGGYNTILNRFNFLEITNLTPSPLNVQVTVIRSDNSILVSGAGVPLLGLQRFDFDIHNAVNNEQSYGSIIVNHSGPLGAISAQISQYAIIDGELRQVAVIPLKTRYAQ